ncbi:MAG: SpoIID/LytB domain-containing protein [Patescibacteria group bacterium]
MKKNKNKLMNRGQKFLSGFLFISILAFIFNFSPSEAEAAVAGYTAQKISQSYGSLTLAPGKAITFEAAFKNTGTATWYNSNSNYISLYVDSIGRQFRHSYWYTIEQPGKMLETKVAPGGTAHFRFALQAPELLGFYTIKLKLAAENLTWIPGGVIDLPINVTNGTTTTQPSTVNSPTSAATATAENFAATKLIQSSQAVALAGGGKTNFTVGFKNIGQAAWEASGTNLVKICVAGTTATEPFRDTSWFATNCPAVVSSITSSGQIGYFSFSLSGNLGGDYNPNFVLMNNDKMITGGEVILPIKISGTVEVPIVAPTPAVVESTIRVGLYNTTTAETLRANAAFEVRDAENNLIFSVTPGATVTVAFNFTAKTYVAALGGEVRENLSYLKFIASDLNTIFEITSFESHPAWNTSLNDNKFRGNLELRWSEDREKLYMINELPLETYLKGLAESSNNNPAEYHRALAIAARTFAQYNLNVGGKHPAGNFHLNASSYDQVYRGYNSEIRLPNFVKAVEDTRGMMVTYNGEVVVTPYFSQSDGRTRAWEEVWWGTGKAWLVSRPDPNCAGMNLFGHGVGLSARGARGMALAGSTFEQIVKHYYTGVELKKVY